MKKLLGSWLTILLFTGICAAQATSILAQQKEEERKNAENERIKVSKNIPLEIYYFEQEPFAFLQNNKPTGVEIDILNEFAQWALTRKGFKMDIKYTPFKKFEDFYKSVVTGNSFVIGAGTVAINEERKNDVIFSSPYLNNVSILISNGSVETIYKKEEISGKWKNMKGITTKESVHSQYMEELKKKYLPGLTIEMVKTPMEVADRIGQQANYIGYIDIVTFWHYLKKSNVFIKIQRAFSVNNEKFGFIMPKNSELHGLITEFFESGFGFTATKNYRDILEKHLGYEVISTVEIRD
ncbi:MAG: transporter substrate-binding domain-containing protein [Flavobacteriales bacterium]|nr:transporter substrate-binding domain-containing protein [Flavobacteriales bacterium]